MYISYIYSWIMRQTSAHKQLCLRIMKEKKGGSPSTHPTPSHPPYPLHHNLTPISLYSLSPFLSPPFSRFVSCVHVCACVCVCVCMCVYVCVCVCISEQMPLVAIPKGGARGPLLLAFLGGKKLNKHTHTQKMLRGPNWKGGGEGKTYHVDLNRR